MEENDNVNLNFEFSKNINSLFTHIKYLKKYNYKIAIYGNGLIGNIVAKELKEQLVIIADKNKNSFSKYAKVCKPEELNNYKFDKLVICVLGREEEIIGSLDIKKDKIFEFNFLHTEVSQIKTINSSTNIKNKNNYNVVFIPHKDYKLVFESNDHSNLHYNSQSTYEEINNKIYKEISKKFSPDIAIDIGANYGFMSLVLSKNFNTPP